MVLVYCALPPETLQRLLIVGLAVLGGVVCWLAQLDHCVRIGFKGHSESALLTIDTIELQGVIGQYPLQYVAIDSMV